MASTSSSCVLKAICVGLFDVGLVLGADFPNPSNVSDLVSGVTPANTIRVINADQAYNMDQNTMDFTYQVTQDEFGTTNLFVNLKSRIEVGISGTQVYNMMGFYDEAKAQWDYLRCAINFDGAVNANANSRYWVISDHYGVKRPYDVGVLSLSLDKTQDWTYLGSDNNYTECPPLAKCVF